jgi:type I restriction enzyme M protein
MGERLTDAMKAIARENPKLQRVIDRRDFNATEAGQRLLEDESPARLMEILNRQPLGMDDVEPPLPWRRRWCCWPRRRRSGGRQMLNWRLC